MAILPETRAAFGISSRRVWAALRENIAARLVRRADRICPGYVAKLTAADDDAVLTDEELTEAAKSDNALLADMAKMELHRRGKGPAPWKITGISPVSFWKMRNSRGE